jgi:hypothetical protein
VLTDGRAAANSAAHRRPFLDDASAAAAISQAHLRAPGRGPPESVTAEQGDLSLGASAQTSRAEQPATPSITFHATGREEPLLTRFLTIEPT